MIARARTFALIGVEALTVDAEVDIHRGLPAFSIVGLPDTAVRESRERVRAAIVNSGYEFPLKRITVSLAPSDLRKAGPGFDLAIATAILVASGQLPDRLLEDWVYAGELALDGRLRRVRGALAMAAAARAAGARGIAVPEANGSEATLVDGLEVAPISALGELAQLARGALETAGADRSSGVGDVAASPSELPDLADLRGQPGLRHALELAAAGGHSLLIVGPPGAGKSMAARRLPSILPPLSGEEAIEVMRIAGAAGLDSRASWGRRPFRAPHHTISAAGLVGGGSPPQPGEITLAHRGVLFLDELAEFGRATLEALREPLEAGEVTIARARRSLRFPARFQLVAAANPCPCGRGEADPGCACGPEQLRRYRARLSGALADRIDIALTVAQPGAAALGSDRPEGSDAVLERVRGARERQRRRYGGGETNAEADDALLRRTAALAPDAALALEQGQRAHRLSGRGWGRVLRLARTEADLERSEQVEQRHVEAALAMRARIEPGG